MGRARWVFVAALLLAGFVFLNNTNLLATPPATKPTLLAHRGLAQTFSHIGLDGDTCTASRIDPPEHPFLENTLPSMQAAFAAGADVVELDVHPTRDGQFAVFHDWKVDCRTNGSGVTREHTLATLKSLDVGHGYTADAGATYPFRGNGIGLLPSLDEVLATFPDKRFLIHIKSNDPDEGDMLSKRLSRLPPEHQALLSVYGGERPVGRVRAHLPHMVTMSGADLRRCMLLYLAIGWSGWVPSACRGSIVLLPHNYAPWVWGWPNRFLARMRAAGALVFATGRWDGEGFSRGIDDAEAFNQLPAGYGGGIWTNRVDRIAPLTR
jgi:glycerophosphoryl diester phosphodiesterase